MSGNPGLWPDIETLIRGHRHAELVATLATLDDAERKACVAPLKAFARPDADGFRPWDYFGSLALVGAGVLPDARTTAAWLRRHRGIDMISGPARGSKIDRDVHPQLEAVLLARDPAWLDALIGMLAANLRLDAHAGRPEYSVVENLRKRRDLAPFTDSGYVLSWAYHGWYGMDRSADPAATIREDPRFAALVPLLFDGDELASALRDYPKGLLEVVALEQVDRGAVLDAMLARLQRGGRPQANSDMAALYRLLKPTLEETDGRRRDLLALLASPTSTVAGLGQSELFALHDAGGLTVDELVEASVTVLRRSDKKLVRAQLTRLRAHVGAHPADAERIALAAAGAFANPAVDLQRTAVDLVALLVDSLDAAGREVVRAAGADLTPDLAADLALVLGHDADADAHAFDPGPIELTPPDAPDAVHPIDAPGELAEELLLLLRGEAWRWSGPRVERVIEAIPRLAGTRPEELRAVGVPILTSEGGDWVRTRSLSNNQSLWRGLYGLLAAALGDPLPIFADEHPDRSGAPQRVLALRVWRAAAAMTANPAWRVVSLPSVSTGAIDGTALVDRLLVAAHEGWDPEPLDLEQAMLRLRLDTAPPEAFAALGIPAGDRVADWIAGNRPRPPSTHLTPVDEQWDTWNYPERLNEPAPQVLLADVATEDGTGPQGEAWALLVGAAYETPFRAGWDPMSAFACWPLILPHHRDVIAAHLVPELSRARSTPCQGEPTLVALALADGPVCDALHALYAYGLAAKQAGTSAASVDALLLLAARDQLDGAAFGRVLADLVIARLVSLQKSVPRLLDLAEGGAPDQVWAALRVLVAAVLRHPGPVAGFADLLAATADVALSVSAGGVIEGLAEFASAKGGTRQLVEARRVLALLR